MSQSQETPFDQLKSFLNKLFQFESQDLDFGIYRILHYKQNEIKEFVEKKLPEKVKAELKTLGKAQVQESEEELKQLEQTTGISKWLEAKSKNDTNRLEIYEEDYKKEIREYRELQRLVKNAQADQESETEIYNHLSWFFSRYYDKGDFISKRRFGKNEKYVVPYNGEETHFYWANHDQYYIKSSETFQKFSFKVPHATGELTAHFKLTDAHVEQGNVKADENKYFVLSSKEPELEGEELSIFFEYRALTDAEKKTITGNSKQDTLDEHAASTLKEKLKKEVLTGGFWKANEAGETFLLKKLHHYTRKNKYDFFIHKNLKPFLQRELDFYIKSELVKVDDLYVTEADFHFDNVKQNFKKIKVFKHIADTLIEFLAQIEEFQKKLWEKKKFVLNTQWVITIDRLVEYIGEEASKLILEEVLKNKKQIDEWIELFRKESLPKGKFTIESLKSDLHTWRKLPIDTVHFSNNFKENLLNVLSERMSLEEVADGLVIHSDNYHGLVALTHKFNDNIKAIYIDPPYNTDASEIIYKNGYKSSSWATLINDRIVVSKTLLKKEGILCATIDDFQQRELYDILKQNFSRDGILGTVVIRNNPSGRPVPSGFGISHEYGLFVSKSSIATVGKFERTDAQNKRYNLKDEQGHYMWELLRKRGSDSERKDSPKAFFPIYYNGKRFRVPSMEWSEASKKWINIEPPQSKEAELLPIDENGVERRWRWGLSTVKDNLKELKVDINSRTVYYKYRPPQGAIPPTNWIDSRYSSTEHGTGILKSLFSQYNPFSYPKSLYAVLDTLSISIGEADNSYILDYFGGSGTTFHATQLLNKSNECHHKCILIEQGNYIYTVIIPRIKKIAYTFDWKDGRPKDGSMNGLGVFFKYHRLEQYEEALENIAFTAPADVVQQALTLDDYIPKYFLEFETRGSQTLVNTAAMADPWDYKLKVWDGFTYDNEQAVDLVETFNYLVGLHMQKCITKQINERKYQFVAGTNNAGRKLLVVWRNTRGWTLEDYEADGKALKEELKNYSYDLLYISGQASIPGVVTYQPIEEIFKNKMLS